MPNDVETPRPEDEEVALQRRREARAALPATYVDTWATSVWRGHLRLVFGEHLVEQPNYRAAFLLELEDAEKLGRHLLKRAADQRARDAAAVAKVQAPEGES